MKKTWIGISIVTVLLAALAITGFALAQDDTPRSPEFPYGQGMMPGYGGRGMHGGFGGLGMMGGWSGENGPMHDIMLTIFAERLDISVEELEARHDAGETMWDIAAGAGLSVEEVQALMLEARGAALEQMVADGLLTQEQADWMLSRMGQMWGGGVPGGCHGAGAGSFGRGGRGSWQGSGA